MEINYRDHHPYILIQKRRIGSIEEHTTALNWLRNPGLRLGFCNMECFTHSVGIAVCSPGLELLGRSSFFFSSDAIGSSDISKGTELDPSR